MAREDTAEIPCLPPRLTVFNFCTQNKTSSEVSPDIFVLSPCGDDRHSSAEASNTYAPAPPEVRVATKKNRRALGPWGSAHLAVCGRITIAYQVRSISPITEQKEERVVTSTTLLKC